MINNASQLVRKGYVVAQGQINNSFRIAPYNATKILGIVVNDVLPRKEAEVASTGVTKVFVGNAVQRGDQIRAIKSADKAYQGQAVRVNPTDTDFFLIGTVMEGGSGLLDVTLSLRYVNTGNTPQSSGITDVYSVDDKNYPIEYIKKVKNGETSTVTSIIKPNGLVFGGHVTVVSGMKINVEKAVYYILKQIYTSSETGLTLQAADPTNPRIDVVVGDINGNVTILTGVASANPIKPVLNSETQVEFTSINIGAGVSTPVSDLELIYDENQEWVGQSTTAKFDSLKSPKNGFYNIETGLLTSESIITFTRASAIEIGDYTQLSLYLRLFASTTANLYASWWNGDTPVGGEVRLDFNKSSLDYQLVATSISISGLVDTLKLRWATNADQSTQGFYMDVVKLDTMTPPQTVDYKWHFSAETPNGIVTVPILNGDKVHFAAGDNVTLERTSHRELGNVLKINTPDVEKAFTELTDVIPTDYTGKANHVPIVVPEEDKLDLMDTELLPTVVAKFTLLADCPTSLAGQAGKGIRVNATEDGLEFYTITP